MTETKLFKTGTTSVRLLSSREETLENLSVDSAAFVIVHLRLSVNSKITPQFLLYLLSSLNLLFHSAPAPCAAPWRNPPVRPVVITGVCVITQHAVCANAR